MALLLLALVSSPANTCMIPRDTRPTLEDCETACGAISCGCSTPWHVVEQETTRTGAKSWFCSSPAASTYALVTPEGSSYRTLRVVESGGGVVEHDGAYRFPDGTYAPACWGYVAAGGASGAYWIDPTGSSPFKVYCEMDTDGGGWTLVDNDVSTTGGFSVRELGANADITVTRGSLLPAYTWSSAPRLLCKSSYYTGTVGWLTLEALDATAQSYPTCCGKNSDGGVCLATCTEGQAGSESGHWAEDQLNGNTNRGMGSWIYTGSGRFGSVWIGHGSKPTCACDYHSTGTSTGLGDKRIRRTDKETAALVGVWRGEAAVHLNLFPETSRAALIATGKLRFHRDRRVGARGSAAPQAQRQSSRGLWAAPLLAEGER